MNQKQLSILIVLVVLIGGLGLYLYQRNNATWQGSDRAPNQKIMGEFPLNDVAQIDIKRGKSEVNLVKQDDLWKVKERYNYPANFSEISDFLRKVYELKGIQNIKVGPSQLGRLELAPPDSSTNSSTLVEFKDKSGKPIQSLLLGKKHMRQSGSPSPFGMDDSGWPDGRFVLVKADKPAPENVWVVSEPFTSIEPKPESWLNKDFIKVEKLHSVSLVSTNATNSWKLGRDTEAGEMKLLDKVDNQEADSSKIYGVSSLFSSANIADVLPPDVKPETVGLDKPISATIDTFDHFTYNVKIGKNTNDDNYPVRVTVDADLPKERIPGKDEKPEDKAKFDKEFKEKNDKLKEKLNQEKAFEKWTFLVSKWTIDPLLKNRADILQPPKTNAPAAMVETNTPPIKVEANLPSPKIEIANPVTTNQLVAIKPAITNTIVLPPPVSTTNEVPVPALPNPEVTNSIVPAKPEQPKSDAPKAPEAAKPAPDAPATNSPPTPPSLK